jgi:hypothetical protein
MTRQIECTVSPMKAAAPLPNLCLSDSSLSVIAERIEVGSRLSASRISRITNSNYGKVKGMKPLIQRTNRTRLNPSRTRPSLLPHRGPHGGCNPQKLSKPRTSLFSWRSINNECGPWI